jgi:threonine aldolase
MKIIDLRSDTVTMPTDEMRTAMAAARLGDDVYREDPTINQLENRAAEMLGMDAGLFVPSGTMGNLCAILTHCNRGDEVIIGDLSHTFVYEVGGIAALGGIHPHTLPNEADGTIPLDKIRAAIRPENVHFPDTRLICLENTQNRCGGAVLSVDYMHAVHSLAKEYGLQMHLDGARLFNAAAVLDVKANEIASSFDSVTFCLSKALCAPVGSILCGAHDFIQRARRTRKQLGGGMRQAGILAAAGLLALEHMTDRLSDDHLKAKNLSDGLKEISGIVVEKDQPESNMVFIRLTDEYAGTAFDVLDDLKGRSILAGAVSDRRIRFVTHYWISHENVAQALEAISKSVSAILSNRT